jgi:hypothetical protein
MRAGEVLKFKRDLAHETRVHNNEYGVMLISSFTSLQDINDLEKESIRNVISHMGLPSIERAEAFYMGREVIPEYLNRALGPDSIKWGSVAPYTNDGLVVFERPLYLNHNDILGTEYDPSGAATEIVPISAMSWCIGSVPTSTEHGSMIWKPGGVVMLWTHSKEILKNMRHYDEQAATDLPFIAYPLTYASAAFGGWFIAENNLRHEDEESGDSIFYNGDSPETAAQSTGVMLVHTLWKMLAERIAISSKRELTGKQKKMTRRAKMRDTGLSIIRLRTFESVGDYEAMFGERLVDWSHRWRVRGHHRKIRDRVTGEEKYVWVRSHIKGPQGKPLRETEKVYAVIR